MDSFSASDAFARYAANVCGEMEGVVEVEGVGVVGFVVSICR